MSLQIKVRNLEANVITRERMLRSNLEEISTHMTAEYDKTTAHLEDLVTELSKRVYK